MEAENIEQDAEAAAEQEVEKEENKEQEQEQEQDDEGQPRPEVCKFKVDVCLCKSGFARVLHFEPVDLVGRFLPLPCSCSSAITKAMIELMYSACSRLRTFPFALLLVKQVLCDPQCLSSNECSRQSPNTNLTGHFQTTPHPNRKRGSPISTTTPPHTKTASGVSLVDSQQREREVNGTQVRRRSMRTVNPRRTMRVS